MGMLIPVATLEKPTLRMQPHDEAIFVAGDGRRARWLRRAALVASVLAGLWVVGLGIGSWLAFDRDWKGVGIWVGLASGLAAVAVLLLARWVMRQKIGLTRHAHAQ